MNEMRRICQYTMFERGALGCAQPKDSAACQKLLKAAFVLPKFSGKQNSQSAVGPLHLP